jgi:hypothetical protein
MPSNPTLPDDVLTEALNAANLAYRGSPWGIDACDKALRTVAPLIIEWAVKGELSEFRHRVQEAFEWPNPELAMDTLARIEFLMIAERFPVVPTPETTGGTK